QNRFHQYTPPGSQSVSALSWRDPSLKSRSPSNSHPWWNSVQNTIAAFLAGAILFFCGGCGSLAADAPSLGALPPGTDHVNLGNKANSQQKILNGSSPANAERT